MANSLNFSNMTIKELYTFAERKGLQDAELRISDGMAVSFYPDLKCVAAAPMELIIDCSSLPMIEYDDLSPSARRVVYFDEWYIQDK